MRNKIFNKVLTLGLISALVLSTGTTAYAATTTKQTVSGNSVIIEQFDVGTETRMRCPVVSTYHTKGTANPAIKRTVSSNSTFGASLEGQGKISASFIADLQITLGLSYSKQWGSDTEYTVAKIKASAATNYYITECVAPSKLTSASRRIINRTTGKQTSYESFYNVYCPLSTTVPTQSNVTSKTWPEATYKKYAPYWKLKYE